MTKNSLNQHINQKGYILYGTFVPILIISLIIFGAGYFLLGEEFNLPSIRKDVTEMRRIEDFPTVVFTRDTEIEKTRETIKSQEELDEFFTRVSPEGELILLEEINFEKEMLIAVSTPSQETTEETIRIKKLSIEDEKGLLVEIIEYARDPETCEIDTQNNVAIDLVAVTRLDGWDIDFDKKTQTEYCD